MDTQKKTKEYVFLSNRSIFVFMTVSLSWTTTGFLFLMEQINPKLVSIFVVISMVLSVISVLIGNKDRRKILEAIANHNIALTKFQVLFVAIYIVTYSTIIVLIT